MQAGVDLIDVEIWRIQALSVGGVFGGGEYFAALAMEVWGTFWCDVCWKDGLC